MFVHDDINTEEEDDEALDHDDGDGDVEDDGDVIGRDVVFRMSLNTF